MRTTQRCGGGGWYSHNHSWYKYPHLWAAIFCLGGPEHSPFNTQDSRFTLLSLTPPLYVTVAQLLQQHQQHQQAPTHPEQAVTVDELVTPAKLCTPFSAFQEPDLTLLPPDLHRQNLRAISLAHCPPNLREIEFLVRVSQYLAQDFWLLLLLFSFKRDGSPNILPLFTAVPPCLEFGSGQLLTVQVLTKLLC